MSTIYVTVGLPASGKTTWAKQMVKDSQGKIKRINKDDLRGMVDVGIWSKQNEKFILKLRDEFIRGSVSDGYDIIVDDTNLAPGHLDRIKEIADSFSAVRVEVKDFTHVSLEECIKRDKKRPNYVGEDVIKDMHKRFIQKKIISDAYRAQNKIPGIPDALIIDLDGTLAHMIGRSPYDESKCDQDMVDQNIREMVNMYHEKGVHIIICSGRDEGRGREATLSWLKSNEISFDRLLMRPAGDTRNDSIIKHEIYDKYIKGIYNVLFILDDRDRVVNKWRELGLICFQVAPGNF